MSGNQLNTDATAPVPRLPAVRSAGVVPGVVPALRRRGRLVGVGTARREDRTARTRRGRRDAPVVRMNRLRVYMVFLLDGVVG